MPTYVKGSKKSGGIEAALAILMSLPYNTESNCRLIQRVVNPLQRKYVVFVDRLDGYAVPLYFLSNYEHRRRSLVEIVRGAPHMDYYTELVGVIIPLKLLLDYIGEMSGVALSPVLYEFRGGVKIRIEKGSKESGQDNSSNGALVEVEKEIENWRWNSGAVAMPYRVAQLIVVPYEPIIDYIYAREEKSPKCEGLLEDLGLCKYLDPDYLGKVALAYRDYCMEGRECETEQRVCVNETWCRSRNVEYDVVWEGDIYKFILRQAQKISRDWSIKFGVIGGIRGVVDGPLKGGSPLKTVRYILEPSPIIKILARSLI
jgi:hypothetical protein